MSRTPARCRGALPWNELRRRTEPQPQLLIPVAHPARPDELSVEAKSLTLLPRNRQLIELCLAFRTSLHAVVDAADGTIGQMLRFGLKPSAIDNVFVTHMHGSSIF